MDHSFFNLTWEYYGNYRWVIHNNIALLWHEPSIYTEGQIRKTLLNSQSKSPVQQMSPWYLDHSWCLHLCLKARNFTSQSSWLYSTSTIAIPMSMILPSHKWLILQHVSVVFVLFKVIMLQTWIGWFFSMYLLHLCGLPAFCYTPSLSKIKNQCVYFKG